MPERPDIDILTDRVEAISCPQCGNHLSLAGKDPFSAFQCSQCGKSLQVPVRLGHFYLVEILGKGGMGAVYKALDQTLGRYVAIKVMRKEMGDNAGALDNFLREARAAAALNHRNVVQIYSCGQEKNQPYIVMEMVGGGRLDKLMAERKPLDEIRVMEVGVDIAQGLGAAHEIGLVHGDIKPANILFGKGGAAKVVDFGLARFVASQQAPGEVWGTPYYIAPEKARKQPEDHRSDIYSLGATLFHALVARPPFDGKTATEVVLARLNQPPPYLRDLRPDIHPETADVIARMLEIEPGRRYPTYKSLLSDLKAARAAVRAGPVPAEPKKGRKKTVITVVLALLVLLGLFVGTGLYLSGRKEKAPVTQPKKPTHWMIVDGKLVPVTEPEKPIVEDTPAEREEESVEPTEKAKPAPLFADPQQQELILAIGPMSEGRYGESEQVLARMYDALPDDGTARYWVRLFQALAAGLAEKTDVCDALLGDIRNAQFPDVEGGTHPGVMVRNLARFLVGDLDEIALYSNMEERPTWYADLAGFFTGWKALRKGDLQTAGERLKDYASHESEDDVRWPYALKGLAEGWAAGIEAWQTADDAARSKSKDGDPDAALMDLAAFRQAAPNFLHLAIDQTTEEIEHAAEEQQRAQEKEQAEHLESVQQDLDLIDKAREALAVRVAEKAFGQALKQLRPLEKDVHTPEGKAWLTCVFDGLQRLDGLNTYLVESVQQKPFGDAAAQELGGAVVGANRDGLKVSLGGYGETIRPWSKISSRLYVWIANHYLAKLATEERAQRLVDVAMYCYEGGGFEPAAKYARQAVTLDGNVSTWIRIHMPGILDD